MPASAASSLVGRGGGGRLRSASPRLGACHDGGVDWPYTRSFAILLVLQALAMLVVRDPPRPAWLRRSVVLGLLPLAGIGGGVLLLGNVPGAPERAVDLAAVAAPALALLGLVAHRLRPRRRSSTSSPGGCPTRGSRISRPTS